MKNIFPILDEILKPFLSSKILSWQHFEKLKWLKNEKCYRVSSSKIPTGGCIDWNYENIEKTLTTFLKDKALHNHIWNNLNGNPGIPIPQNSLDKRGYVFHYSTTVFGDRNKLNRDKTTDWYNRITDFRFQIQYFYNQFSDLGVNQIIDISFRQSYLNDSERDNLVRNIFNKVNGKFLYKRIDIENPCSFTETYEKAYYIEKEKLEEWKQI